LGWIKHKNNIFDIIILIRHAVYVRLDTQFISTIQILWRCHPVFCYIVCIAENSKYLKIYIPTKFTKHQRNQVRLAVAT